MVKWRRNNIISTLIVLEQGCFDVVWPWCAHWVVYKKVKVEISSRCCCWHVVNKKWVSARTNKVNILNLQLRTHLNFSKCKSCENSYVLFLIRTNKAEKTLRISSVKWFFTKMVNSVFMSDEDIASVSCLNFRPSVLKLVSRHTIKVTAEDLKHKLSNTLHTK